MCTISPSPSHLSRYEQPFKTISSTPPTLFICFFFLMIRRPPRSTLFPTRRSSDLHRRGRGDQPRAPGLAESPGADHRSRTFRDRKSTRLNSSHGYISYAVFCLKKKKNNTKARTKSTPDSHVSSTIHIPHHGAIVVH